MIESITITSKSGRGSLAMGVGDYRGYWLESVDWGQVQGAHNTYRFFNQIGESVISTSVGTRSISINGVILTDDPAGSLQERCDFLNTFISPAEDYELAAKGRKIEFRPDSSIIYSREFRSNNQIMRRFLIQGTAHFPLFTGAASEETDFKSVDDMFIFPNAFGLNENVVFGITKEAYQKEIINNGGFETSLVINVTFIGDVLNPRFWNLTTGKFIGVNRAFLGGEMLEIDTTAGSKRISLLMQDSAESVDIMKNLNYRSSWIQLVPGLNRIAADCDNEEQRSNMELNVSYSPLFMEVE